MVNMSKLGIFYLTLFICGAVNSSQNNKDDTTFPPLLPQTWHIRESIHENVTRINFDEHVALYYDSDRIIDEHTGTNKSYYKEPPWPLSELSTAWKYAKDTYGPIGPDPRLFLILHTGKLINQANQGCMRQSFLNPTGIQRNLNIIDCYFPTVQVKNGLVDTAQNFETIFSQIGDIIRYGVEGEDYDADRKICGSAMSDILFYDIYRHLRSNSSPDDVAKWKDMLRYSGKKECFYTWFVPIYEKYGDSDSRASVLNKYFKLTNQYWHTTERAGRCGDMNLGEFLHFWSGAAGEDLQRMAAEAFGWTEDQQTQLLNAQHTFHQFNYPSNSTMYTVILNPPSTNKHSTNKPSTNKHSKNTDSKFKEAEIAFAIVGICIVIVVLVFVFSVLSVRNKTKLKKLEKKYRDLTLKDVNAFRMGVMHMNLGVGSHLSMSILSMPFNMAFEVPAERIAIDKSHVLGQGEFGIVYLGVLKGENGTPDVKVAVKKTKLGTQLSHFKALLSEIKIMAHLEKHENIAALLATVTISISKCEVVAALEFCEKGDLLDNLRKCRRSFRNLWNQHYSKWTKTDYVEVNTTTQRSPCGLVLAMEPENITEISTLDLISWSGQIANGMLFLSSKDIIHGDLAARNVLLTADNIPKICDFGLSRKLIKYSNYRKTSSTPVPWKWLAIEALTHRTFSIQSDVWSFGVTLWEIFTLGKEPYPGRNWDTKFVDDLIDGDGLLAQPEFGNSEIHDLMMNCMQEVPKDRFSFERIKTELENIEASLET